MNLLQHVRYRKRKNQSKITKYPVMNSNCVVLLRAVLAAQVVLSLEGLQDPPVDFDDIFSKPFPLSVHWRRIGQFSYLHQ
jgi:hypothetical protein